MATLALLIISLALLAVDPSYTMLAQIPGENFAHFFLRFFTYQLDHAYFLHLFKNYTSLIPAALYLEYRIGSLKFLATFFFCGFCAALVQMLVVPSTLIGGMIGSSGAEMGLIGAACAFYTRRWWQRILSLFIVGSFFSIFVAQLFDPGVSSIAHWAHIGGLVSGILLGSLLSLNHPSRRKKS